MVFFNGYAAALGFAYLLSKNVRHHHILRM
jgi:hypothetical protein